MALHFIDRYDALSNQMVEGDTELMTRADHKFLLYRLSDGFYATSHQCTHLFKSLKKGVIVSDKTIRCPLHHAEFDIRSGEVDTWACFPKGIVNVLNAVRSEKPLASYPITVDDDKVFIDLPEKER